MGAGVWLSVLPWARPWILFPAQRQSKAKSNKRLSLGNRYFFFLLEIVFISSQLHSQLADLLIVCMIEKKNFKARGTEMIFG